jgi:hypothetical protein
MLASKGHDLLLQLSLSVLLAMLTRGDLVLKGIGQVRRFSRGIAHVALTESSGHCYNEAALQPCAFSPYHINSPRQYAV